MVVDVGDGWEEVRLKWDEVEVDWELLELGKGPLRYLPICTVDYLTAASRKVPHLSYHWSRRKMRKIAITGEVGDGRRAESASPGWRDCIQTTNYNLAY